jgi:predicted ATPase/DNA-binding winged helix-turn-helix (wHTH) protein
LPQDNEGSARVKRIASSPNDQPRFLTEPPDGPVRLLASSEGPRTQDAPPLADDLVLSFGPFRLVPAQRVLQQDGQAVRLGGRAFDLLLALALRPGEVVGKEELLTAVWRGLVVDESGLRVQMAALRKALGEHRSDARYIATVPQRGYTMVVPVARQRLTATLLAPVSKVLPVAPAAVKVSSPIGTLPAVLTRLIGREAAVQAVIDTLPARRFVSLVGPGGMGKTTTSLVAAARLAPAYPDGAFFVDLGSLSDPALLPDTVATALGIRTRCADDLPEIAARLAAKSMLILLDNCEHVVAAAAAMAEFLLGQSPGIHVLATSREPLRAQGEWVQRLASLAIPAANPHINYAEALAYPAFELFVERAAAHGDGMGFGDADVATIARICSGLDGIPLAIELVAARTGAFGLSGLARALDAHLPLPTLGLRTALPRHQTLQATLDWSHALLPAAEQRLLRRLSVFRDRFTLPSVLAIDATPGQHDAQASELALMNLIAKSLVVAQHHEGEIHYRLLETTRAYATRCLADSGELPAIARRHALICHDCLLRAAEDFESLLPARWRARYARVLDDVRAALAWAAGPDGDCEIAALLIADSASLWFGIGAVHDYLDRVDHAIRHLPPGAVGTRLDMRLSLAFGQTGLAMRGAVPAVRAALTRCIAIGEKLHDTDYQLRALWGVFAWETYRGNYADALDATEAFGAVVQASHAEKSRFAYHRIKAVCLHMLGRQAEALEHARRSLAPAATGIRQLHGSPFQFDHRTAALTQLARILWLQGFPDQAAAAARDAVDTATAFDDALSLTYALAYAACPIALWNGHGDVAQAYNERLRQHAESNALVFWQSWSQVYGKVIDVRRGGVPLACVDDASLQTSVADMLSTLTDGEPSPLARSRAEAGENAWCMAEVLRVSAINLLARSPQDLPAAEATLRHAMQLAEQQGARAWVLRAATSLAALLHADGRNDAARQVLAGPLAAVTEGFGTADVIAARRLGETLTSNNG